MDIDVSIPRDLPGILLKNSGSSSEEFLSRNRSSRKEREADLGPNSNAEEANSTRMESGRNAVQEQRS